VCGVALQENLRLVLSPSSSHRGRGSRNQRKNRKENAPTASAITRFHADLKSEDLDGIVVMFRAKANQFISVILSPFPGLEKLSVVGPGADAGDETKEETSDAVPEAAAAEPEVPPSIAANRYEIVFGGNNNTTTTIRKVAINGSGKKDGSSIGTRNEISSSVIIPSRVCRGFGGTSDSVTIDDSDENDGSWMSYWLCLSNSRMYVGVGRVPGKECFGVLEEKDESVVQQESNESQEEGSDKDESTMRSNQEIETAKVLPIRYVGIGNDAAVQKYRDSVLHVKDVIVTNVPPCLESLLEEIPSQDDLPIVCLALTSSSLSGMEIDEDTETLKLKKYMEDYKAECLTRKKRAKKYGTDYREQPMKEFLPWTMAKRLKGNHGVDSSATTKLQKAGFVAGDIDFLDPNEVSKREARLARFTAKGKPNNDSGGDANSDDANDAVACADSAPVALVPKRDGLPLEQAWDKESMLQPIRRDPPPYLWKESPSNMDTLKTTRASDPFAMYDETTKAATWITDKLHFSAIDWASFKQIRNDDLLQHLESYGPIKYIEWLGDVSCNVCFKSKAAASRALVCLSNELPSPTLPGAAPTVEVNQEGDPQPPTTEAAPSVHIDTRIDLGCMTWRFSKRPIRKTSNDRFGRKGTTARYLLRLATTDDVLIDRPSSWPEPPGGFHADRVLGPNSDYAAAKKRTTKPKKKKNHQQVQQNQQNTKKSQMQQQQNPRGKNSKRKRGRGDPIGKSERKKKNENSKTIKNPIDLLNCGLSSRRGGFSVEEMEKERQAKKRQKTS